MKVRYGTLFLIGITMIMSQWGCKSNNITGTTIPTSAVISGTVTSSLSSTSITGALVVLSYGSVKDTTYSQTDGTFQFPPIEISSDTTGVNVNLTVSASGFISRTYSNINVKTNVSIPITLDINPALYAKVVGVVRDSASTYPLNASAVLINLPGIVDTTTTLQNGAFTIYVNLQGLSVLNNISMTISKDGFKTYRTNLSLKSGTDSVGTIYLAVDQASAIAHVSGVVTDSRTGSPIPSVTVILLSSLGTDSTKTLGDGSYRFDPNLQGQPSAPMTLTFRQSGYNTSTLNFSVNAGETVTESIVLTSNWNYASITGTVRDSATSLPLSGAKVIVALTGTTSSNSKFMASLKSHSHSISSIILDSTTTFVDGSFSLAINLVDLDSLSATITISEPGYKVLQFARTFIKGSNELGNVFIQIDNGLTTATITGYVTDSHSLLPITGVSVYLTTPIKVDSTKTSNSGAYSFNLNLQGLSTVYGTLRFSLNSYTDQTVNFSANAGQTVTQSVALVANQTVVGGDSSTARGVARSISLVSVSRQEISVHGVGRNETSVLVWQALDSLGFPIDINHQQSITFIPTGTPVTLGGAYVTPTTGLTDGSGDVSTTINSGTVAGTIQLTAKLTLSNGVVVQSSPVLITVDGGLPDQGHFSINSNQPHARNFAGYDWSEIMQGFTVQAGDKYGNPVAPSTAIYFNSTAGIITAAGQTDATGHANATLFSGNPQPVLSPSLLSSYEGIPQTFFGDGTGYAFVKAFTQGENNANIGDSDLICISATIAPITITLLSPSDTVHSGGSLLYHVHISDRFGNPLESGTTITANVSVPTPPPSDVGVVWSVVPAGLTSPDGGSFILSDNLVRDNYPSTTGSTDFDVVVSATLTQGSSPQSTTFSLSIDVQGRNTNGDIVQSTVSGVAVAP